VVQITLSGDLIFARILDQEAVIINSQHVAEALLDKRSRIYSDRPYLATVKPYYFPIILLFSQFDVQAGLAGRAILDSRGIMMNGVFVDASSTKRSVPSLHASFAQCTLSVPMR
jgi:hypothetical protein